MTRRPSLIVLLLFALALRLAWGLSRPADVSADLPDQREYLAIGRNLLHGQGLRFYDERFGEDEVAFRSPGYPAFVALCGASPRVVRVGQALLDTSAILAIYLLAKRWLDERASLLAAALIAFNPFLIFFSGLVLSETLFTAALAWGMVLLALSSGTPGEGGDEGSGPLQIDSQIEKNPHPTLSRRTGRGANRAVFVVGLVALAVAVLVRPAALVLPPILAGLAMGPSRRRMFGGLLAGAAASFLVLLPWAYRNHTLLGEWVWTTTNAGQTAYDGFRPGADGSSNLAELPTMPELRGKSELERDRYLTDRGRELMTADPQRSLSLAVRKVARTWSPVPLSDEYASARNRVIGLAYGVPFLGLTLIGLFRRRLSGKMKRLCLLPAIYFTAAAAVTVGSLRYRIPAEPPMAVIAASAVRQRLKAEG